MAGGRLEVVYCIPDNIFLGQEYIQAYGVMYNGIYTQNSMPNNNIQTTQT